MAFFMPEGLSPIQGGERQAEFETVLAVRKE